jgi:hypothetical protein
VEEGKDQLLNPTSHGLIEKLKEADSLFKNGSLQPG